VLAGLALAALAASAPSPARADVVPVKSAELRIAEGDAVLSAEFELARSRWYWTAEKIADWSITYRVSYNALTRQYRVGSGPLGQQFESLEEVQRFLGRVSSRPVVRAETLTRGTKYEAAIRLKLDVNQLPKPFQVSALASREWQLASDWYRWTFVP